MLSHTLSDPVSNALLPLISILFHQPEPSVYGHVQLQAESGAEDGAQHDRVSSEEGAVVQG
jgi:homogentisate 1,2-dioxygenase